MITALHNKYRKHAEIKEVKEKKMSAQCMMTDTQSKATVVLIATFQNCDLFTD